MIALAGLLILVAGALLVGGLGNGETTMLWGSVGVSAVAAVVLVLNTVRRNRAAADDEVDRTPEPAPARTTSPEPRSGTEVAPEPATVRAPAVVPAAESAAGPEPATVRTEAVEPDRVPAASEPRVQPELPAAHTEAAPEPAAVRTDAGQSAPEADTVRTEPVREPEPAAVRAEPVAPDPLPATAEDPEARPEPAVEHVEPEPVVVPPRVGGPSTGSHAARAAESVEDGEPVEEIVEVTDLLMILDLTDEVVVVDEHPRYHLAGCGQTAGEEEFPLPLSEAREDGFTACGVCRPDRHLADRERQRRAAARA